MNPNPQSKAITLEIVAPEVETKLIRYASQTGLEKQSTETLVESFRPIFAKAREAIADAAGVAESVKDATCVREIMRSRACRLALRKIRLESDQTRERHKKHALLYGRAVDGFHNILLADLSPVETALKNAEDIAERAEAERLATLRASREAELVPLLDEPLLGNLADLSEADYKQKLANAKLLRQAKLDAAAKLEAERKAKEEAAFIAAAKAEAENVKLKAEAVAREAAAKAEREAAEKKLAEERAEAARVAAKLKAQADASAKAAAEQAARERAKVEAEARMEREAIQFAANEAARKAQVETVRLKAELAAKAKAEADEVARVESERRTAAAAEKRAASAVDGVKLKRFADELRALPKPSLKDASVQADLSARVEKVATWAEQVLSDKLL